MKTKLSLRMILLLMIAAFTALSCQLPAAVQEAAQGVSATQSASNGAPSSKPVAGKAELPDPSVGLKDLKAYHAVMRVDTLGKLDGQPFERHTQVEITRGSNGNFNSRTMLAGGGRSVRLVSSNGAFYRWSGEKSDCEGSVEPPMEDEVIEPAALLLPVGIASRVGVEPVGEVTSVHFSFDQNGLARFNTNGPVRGDFWIAENGGYVVKYILKSEAPQKPLANGLAVAQTYTYELTPGAEAVGLPEGCTQVPTDLPVITDAQNVARGSGLVTYQTGSTPRAVFDFYAQQLPGLGWKPEVVAPEGEIKLPFFVQYSQDNLRLTISLSLNEDKSLGVELAQMDLKDMPSAPPQATPTAAGTPTPEPTVNQAESGLPDGVPLYPGATGLIKANGAVMFIAAAPSKDVIAFYKKQMSANGWSSVNEFSIPDGTSQTWKKDGAMISLMIMSDGDNTRVVVTKAD